LASTTRDDDDRPVDVVPLTADSPEAHLDGWARLYRALVEEEIPELEPPDRRESLAELDSDDDRRATGLLAVHEGEALGALLAHLPLREDRDRADITLFVTAEARRTGLGRRLVDDAAQRLRGEGRAVLRGAVASGSAGERFAAAVRARETQRVVRSDLDLTAVDPGRLAAQASRQVDGYRLLCWDDRCPDDLLEQFARARTAMNDAPVGDASRDPLAWDGERVRRHEAQQMRRGYRGLTTAVVHDASGEVAGFTQIFACGTRPRGVEQDDTAVVAAHRGHGLGLFIKAVNLQRLILAEPDTRWVVTWNAAENRFMRAVNETLGFAPRAEELELELALP
jgi:GNAT superfamily N-acetyltransferase